MDKRIILVAFNGEAMCFVHVLLNALDMSEKGCDVKVVIEGAATKQVKEMNDDDNHFSKLYRQVRDKGLIDCVCYACASKMGAEQAAEAQGLPLSGEMKGHPSLAKYLERDYAIITF